MSTSRSILAAVALLVLSATSSAQERSVQTVNVPLSRPGEAISMEVNLMAGEIHVVGEDRQDVLFEIRSGDSGRRIVTPSGTRTIPGGGLDLKIEEQDNRVEVDSDWRTSEVSITARVPIRASLSLETVHQGVITVRDIEGELELDNVHGPITASGIRGSVIAESVHGNIDIELLSAPEDKPMALTSMHGSLTLKLPADHGAVLHILSQADEIHTDFDIELLPSEPKVSRRGNGGRFVVEMDQEVVVAINGGGPQVRLETRYGNVRVLKTGH